MLTNFLILLVDRISELKKGIKTTSRYIFSHHKESEYYKCYILDICGNKLAICARCLGIYLGIFLGIICFIFGIYREFIYVGIAVFPAFALLDWSASAFFGYVGTNLIRSATGLFLGISYSMGFMQLYSSFPDYYIIAIGVFYISFAGFLLFMNYQLAKRISVR